MRNSQSALLLVSTLISLSLATLLFHPATADQQTTTSLAPSPTPSETPTPMLSLMGLTYCWPQAPIPAPAPVVLGATSGARLVLPATSSQTCTPGDASVDISSFLYVPMTTTICIGAQVTWINHDVARHGATSDLDDWDTGLFRQGQSGSITFNTAGTFGYYCRAHDYMRGAVVVLDSATPTPTATATLVGTPTPGPTSTPTATRTPTPTATATRTPRPTSTPLPSPTPTDPHNPGPTPTATPTSVILDPMSIPKFSEALLIPPAMPRTAELTDANGQPIDYYEIAARQFQQYILPRSMGLAPSAVWGYGAVNHPDTFSYPGYTIEAQYNRPVRVKWINDLVDSNDAYLPYFLPVDQTLHWANPAGGADSHDMHGMNHTPYTGPVPLVTHLHGGHTYDDSDGYPEAWYLPNASNIPVGFARTGSWYDLFKAQIGARLGIEWTAGSSTYDYPNDQPASTLWYHDHTLGVTRVNVYAGLSGFYLVRGGPNDLTSGVLPGPAPTRDDDALAVYRELPLLIQDRSFKRDGSLYFPDSRAQAEGLHDSQLQVPFMGDPACDGDSDVPPIWSPEFYGNTLVVNGRTWPYQEVEPRRYRLRLLNGSNARFLMLKFGDGTPFYQIGAEGGFLPAPARQDTLLLAPAERADVIVDFSDLPVGTQLTLLNVGPDGPFHGGQPGQAFTPANPATTGQVMQFRVVASTGPDSSTPPTSLTLPSPPLLGPATNTRQVSLSELESQTVFVNQLNDAVVLDCNSNTPLGVVRAKLGVLNDQGGPVPLAWMDVVTENPTLNTTEVWEIYNFTMHAHPIHIHQRAFEVVNREVRGSGVARPPDAWEQGFKDTVIAYPGEITRVKVRFDLVGRYVWHCHTLGHEDNDMMRPIDISPQRLFLPLIHKGMDGLE